MQYERGNHFPWKLLLLYCCSLNMRDFHDLNDEGFFYHHVNENSGFGKALVMMKKFHVTQQDLYNKILFEVYLNSPIHRNKFKACRTRLP